VVTARGPPANVLLVGTVDPTVAVCCSRMLASCQCYGLDQGTLCALIALAADRVHLSSHLYCTARLPTQTPTSAGPQQLPFSPGSFQPSSVSTYQAALAAAQAALHQQHQQAAGQLSQQANAAGAAAAGTSWGAWRPSAQSWQQQQQQQQQQRQVQSLAGFSPVQAAAAAAASAAMASGSMQPSPGGLPAGMLQQQLLRSGLAAAGDAAAGGSRWTSMDGSSPGGTPPLAAMPSAEDVPNPADFDPLWR